MTENEKRILTLLYKSKSLTKPEICKKGRMGWATAVKLINRLQEADIIESTGIVKRSGGQGKNPEKYELKSRTLMAIGMDVEYKVTRIILTNLKGEILANSIHKTPQNPSSARLKKFLTRTLSDFISQHIKTSDSLAGIGIGLPGIGMLSWIKHNKEYSTDLSIYLEKELNYKVRIDINVRVYSVFEKWDKRTFSLDDFMVITIRTGIGSGIFINGSLFYGHQEHSGEIGHMTVLEDGDTCVCGRKGCLQTVVNQNQLYRDYLIKAAGSNKKTNEFPSHDDLISGLADLFTRAKKGETEAENIVKQAAVYLGECLASSIMILNLPHIIISGHFGIDGNILIDFLKDEIRKRILSRMEYNLAYYSLDDKGFTMGAALLILKDYYTEISTPLDVRQYQQLV